MNRLSLLILSLLITAVFLISCSHDDQKKYQPEYSVESIESIEKEYILGIHPLHNPKRLDEIFGPVADYLTEHIEGARFKIEASRDYAAYDKKLYSRKFDFSLPNPFQTVQSLKHGYSVFGKMSDDQNFRGIIVVRKDSGIKQVSDLKGLAVSFPAPTALAATMMPQAYLQSHGLDVMQDIDIRYVGSQESSIMNVMLGITAAGASWPPPWLALVDERPEILKEMKIIWETKPLINNGLVVRNDVTPAVLEQVKQLLFNLHKNEQGSQWLKKMKLSKFESANNSTYEPVIRFINHFSETVRPIE
jgi:phosphonate transport system substrate-binding protein